MRGRCCGGGPACCPAIEEALETIGLTDLADKPAGVLAHGQKQWLEIGMLLVQNADVLLLDEPVAGMSHEEREETGNLLRRIGAERTVVVVEHDMDFMRAFATSVTVLARGQVIAEGTVAEVQANPKVQEVYLGTAAAGVDGHSGRTHPERRRPDARNSSMYAPATAAPRSSTASASRCRRTGWPR